MSPQGMQKVMGVRKNCTPPSLWCRSC